MRHIIETPETLGMVRVMVLEYFEKQSYALTSLDPNELHFKREGSPAAEALILLSNEDEGTKLELDWRLTGNKDADSPDAQAIERECQGLLAAVKGEIVEGAVPSASATLHPPKMMDAKTFNTLVRGDMVFRSSARWFYWIAGLSLINSIVFRMDGNINFLFGLGATQVVDILSQIYIEEGLFTDPGMVSGISMAVVILLSGLYIGFGILTRKKKKWAFYTGTVLYTLDGLLLLFLMRDYISVAFHAYILFSLFRVWKTINDLQNVKDDLQPPAPRSSGG